MLVAETLPVQYYPCHITTGLAECSSHCFFKGIQVVKVFQKFVLGLVMLITLEQYIKVN